MNSKIKKLILFILLFSFSKHSYAQLIPDFRVNTDLTNYNQRFSKVSADKEGNFVITWNDERVFNTNEVYFQVFNKNGSFIGVNKKPYTSNILLSGSPVIVVMETRDFFLTYGEYNTLTQKLRICIQHFNEIGDSMSVAQTISDDTITRQGTPSISTSSFRNLVVCWEFHPDNNFTHSRIMFQRFDSLGNRIGNNVIATDTLYSKTDPAITVRKDGSFIIIWSETNQIGGKDCYCQMFDNQGNKIGSKILASQIITAVDQYTDPQIASDSSGRFCAVFDRYNINSNLSESFFQLFDKNGIKKGNNIIYNESFDGNQPTIASEINGDMLIGYVIQGQTVLLKIDTLGNQIGNSFYISNQSPGTGKVYSDYLIINNRIISTWSDVRNHTDGDIYANIRSFINPDSVVAIHSISTDIPTGFKLFQNYPNPFNPNTKINYELINSKFVSLKVYDVLGNEVETLVSEKQNAGSYSVTFDAASKPSGIYFYKLVTDDFSETKKMVLVK